MGEWSRELVARRKKNKLLKPVTGVKGNRKDSKKKKISRREL